MEAEETRLMEQLLQKLSQRDLAGERPIVRRFEQSQLTAIESTLLLYSSRLEYWIGRDSGPRTDRVSAPCFDSSWCFAHPQGGETHSNVLSNS